MRQSVDKYANHYGHKDTVNENSHNLPYDVTAVGTVHFLGLNTLPGSTPLPPPPLKARPGRKAEAPDR